MRTNVETVVRELDNAILSNENEPNRLKRVCFNLQLARKAVEQIMETAENDPDLQSNEEEQIRFNRYQLPVLLSKWVFFQKAYQLECISLASTREKKKALLTEQLQEARDFFFDYKGFIQYYLSEDQQLDKDLFTRQSSVGHQLMHTKVELPSNLSPGCQLATYLLTYLEFARLLLLEINDDDRKSEELAPVPDLTYKGKIIDIIELGMLLYSSKAFYFRGKPATEKVIFERLETAFGIPLGNISQRITELKNRREPLEKVNHWTKMANDHLGNLPDDRSRRKIR